LAEGKPQRARRVYSGRLCVSNLHLNLDDAAIQYQPVYF
jgi:hypothetical protein